MKYLKNLSLVAVCLLTISLTQINAQKFGYLNSMNLLQEMPETTTADKELVNLQADLTKSGEDMMKSLEAEYQQYVGQAQAGGMTPVEQQQKEAALNQKRNDIAKYEQEAVTKVQQKRQELLNPIIEKINKAIEAVGKENGYTMIFDESVGVILFNVEKDDVSALVRAKLGM